MPTLLLEQSRDAPITVTAIRTREIDDRSRKRLFIGSAMTFLALGRTMLTNDATGPAFRDSQLGSDMFDAMPAAGGA